MQTVCRRKSPLNGEADVPAVAARLLHRLHGRPTLAKRLHHGDSARILEHRPGKISSRLRLSGRMLHAVLRHQKQTQKRRKRTCQRNQRHHRVKKQQKQKDTQKVQIAAHKIVNHADSHVL